MINASQIHIRKTQQAVIKPAVYYVNADAALDTAQMSRYVFIKLESASSLDKPFAFFSLVGHICKQCETSFCIFKDDAF